jgi:hypothetical protein
MLSRVQLANYFKQQCFEVIGITPQRLGQQIGQTDTAKGIEQAVTGSYAQTETYFIQHCDYLMPRVHQMRTDLAQYYHSTKPSFRLQYITSNEDKVNFEMNGTDLLLRDINVFSTTKANQRAILEQMKQLVTTNNTNGATIYDLGSILQTESMAELNHVLKNVDKKVQAQRQSEMAHEEKLKQMEVDQKNAEKQMMVDADLRKEAMKNRTTLLAAEIKASGYGAMQDINENNQSDFNDSLDRIQQTDEFQQTMNLDKTKVNNQVQQSKNKEQLEREKLQTAVTLKQMDVNIAKENKNRFDKKTPAKKK